MYSYRKRRFILMLIVGIISLSFLITNSIVAPSLAPQDSKQLASNNSNAQSTLSASDTPQNNTALVSLEKLEVKGRAPKTGYSRAQFSNGWQSVGGCDMRNRILKRDLTNIKFVEKSNCLIASGTLDDPYTGKQIQFQRGNKTSSLVQIDHVVALSDAWQKGAQKLTVEQRLQLANDPLELIAVDGKANIQKSDGDSATWLPPNKAFRCQYIARQIAVKLKYQLWITTSEKETNLKILSTCPNEPMPSP